LRKLKKPNTSGAAILEPFHFSETFEFIIQIVDLINKCMIGMLNGQGEELWIFLLLDPIGYLLCSVDGSASGTKRTPSKLTRLRCDANFAGGLMANEPGIGPAFVQLTDLFRWIHLAGTGISGKGRLHLYFIALQQVVAVGGFGAIADSCFLV
jgi:hypothetical protein